MIYAIPAMTTKYLHSLFLLTFAFSQLGNEYEDTSSVDKKETI